jgi:hypothetical protein
MASKLIVDENEIEDTIRMISRDTFTVLDFTQTFMEMYPEDCKGPVELFGLSGSRRRYTVSTYFSNRLDAYSQKAYCFYRKKEYA